MPTEADQLHAELAAHRQLAERLAEAQRVGRMGSYDWHIPTDTNSWSDELYRIYGTEPQSFNASYDRFMEFVHPDDRPHIRAVHEEAFRTHEPYHTEERIVRADGEVRVLSTTGEVGVDDLGQPIRIYGICMDITEQRRAEEEALALSMRLHDAEVRRQHALEINDNVVQGLTSALYAFESGLFDDAMEGLRRTVASARVMMNDLLAGTGDAELKAGDLVRNRALTPLLSAGMCDGDTLPFPEPEPVRVLLIDDSDDVRMILRRLIGQERGCSVVGEARDGLAGVRLAEQLRPDVVLLDLAMPVMDGLEALPQILAAVPHAKVIVLSGFDRARMEATALAAGAHLYLEKGLKSNAVIDAIDELVPGRLRRWPSTALV
jgi:PAS domain S-box-containing protein